MVKIEIEINDKRTTAKCVAFEELTEPLHGIPAEEVMPLNTENQTKLCLLRNKVIQDQEYIFTLKKKAPPPNSTLNDGYILTSIERIP